MHHGESAGQHFLYIEAQQLARANYVTWLSVCRVCVCVCMVSGCVCVCVCASIIRSQKVTIILFLRVANARCERDITNTTVSPLCLGGEGKGARYRNSELARDADRAELATTRATNSRRRDRARKRDSRSDGSGTRERTVLPRRSFSPNGQRNPAIGRRR